MALLKFGSLRILLFRISSLLSSRFFPRFFLLEDVLESFLMGSSEEALWEVCQKDRLAWMATFTSRDSSLCLCPLLILLHLTLQVCDSKSYFGCPHANQLKYPSPRFYLVSVRLASFSPLFFGVEHGVTHFFIPPPLCPLRLFPVVSPLKLDCDVFLGKCFLAVSSPRIPRFFR